MNVIPFVAEWALRSAILILTAATVLWMLRVKDSSVRLAAWTAMLAGSILIPVLTAMLPPVPIRVAAITATVPATIEPATVGSFPAVAAPATRKVTVRTGFSPDWPSTELATYLLIACVMLLRLLTGFVVGHRLLRRSTPADRVAEGLRIRESAGVSAPVTLGILRPVIVLPLDWTQWGPEKLDAVLAHERAHVRRYDPFVQLLSAVHRAVFWFSPAAWLLHSRIVRLAEEASDDAAVAVVDPAAYAEVLLDFMRRPVLNPDTGGIPMARHGRPDRRIQRILEATSFSHGITRWGVAGIIVLGMPVAYFAASSRPQEALSHSVSIALPPADSVLPVVPEAPRLVAQVAVPAKVQPVPEKRPKFDVASVKPCDPDAPQAGGRGGKIGPGPTRFRRNCITVLRLIQDAYIRFADGENRSPMLTVLTKIEGGPSWINSDEYTIEAESESAATIPTMSGPMVQTLLEERFQLKTHRVTREGPIYELTVAKVGSKLAAAKEGPCVASDFVDSPFPAFLPPPLDTEIRQCEFFWMTRKGPNRIVSARSTTMGDFAATLTGLVDSLVVDKTGITGKVDFRFMYGLPVPLETQDSPVEPAEPSIFTVLQQQLGLKLEPARGARDYLVIDSISRPSPN